VCIAAEDHREIGSKQIIGNSRNTINTDRRVYGMVRIMYISVTCGPIVRERVDKHVSMETSDQQTFPRIPISCISGRSDKNQVSHGRIQVRTVEDRLEQKTDIVKSNWSDS
jgi:hypothetical protein